MRGAVFTHAKLNWDLRVLGRRADGYHELRSWFAGLSWCDVLYAETASAAVSALAVAGDEADGVPSDARNLVLRAERAWREAFPTRARRVAPLRWTLDKRIPHGAGLGGGSSNAAGALALLERFAGPEDAEPARLRAVAAALGSDVCFFLEHEGGAEWRGGRGERRLAQAPIPSRRVLVALPEFRLATASVYAALRAPAWSGVEPPIPAAPAPEPGPNQLEAAAWSAAPALAGWAAAVFGELPCLLCGSGSAYFSAPAETEYQAWWAGQPWRRCARMIQTELLAGPALRIRME